VIQDVQVSSEGHQTVDVARDSYHRALIFPSESKAIQEAWRYNQELVGKGEDSVLDVT
jgi:hypothetical protein